MVQILNIYIFFECSGFCKIIFTYESGLKFRILKEIKAQTLSIT